MNNIHPLFLRPAVKDYLWGGDRLKTEYGKSYVDISPLAECWECSTHPDGISTVDGGEYDGMGLDEVIRRNPEYLGSKFKGLNELPILVKLIDAKDKLSVQVHPDDEYAFKHEDGSRGKTEMWYILDASPDAEIIYGTHTNAGIEEIKLGIENGTVEKYLRHIKTQKNEIYMIKPGTVHAIGAGNVIAEIQESSNITYRLFDYDRCDKNGNRRPLHVEKARDVIRIGNIGPLQPIRVLRYKKGYASEVLLRCPFFEVSRILINADKELKANISEESYAVWLCIEGVMTVGRQTIRKGRCVFIPAGAECLISGNGVFLSVTG